MVAGGLPEPRDDHAVAVADMALHMLDVVVAAGSTLGRPLQVRIGIHSGAAVAGIIGKHKFIYDVWGDTVNTANRMESHGVPDRVQISAATYHRVRGSLPLRTARSAGGQGQGHDGDVFPRQSVAAQLGDHRHQFDACADAPIALSMRARERQLNSCRTSNPT